MAENDWFSVVKVSTVWDSNVSDERLNYFIWNAFQTDKGKLDSFYRNNYYTYYEFKDNFKKYALKFRHEPKEVQRKMNFMKFLKKADRNIIEFNTNVGFYMIYLSKAETYVRELYEHIGGNNRTGNNLTGRLKRGDDIDFLRSKEQILNVDGFSGQTKILSGISKKEFNDIYNFIKKQDEDDFASLLFRGVKNNFNDAKRYQTYIKNDILSISKYLSKKGPIGLGNYDDGLIWFRKWLAEENQ